MKFKVKFWCQTHTRKLDGSPVLVMEDWKDWRVDFKNVFMKILNPCIMVLKIK